MLLNHELSLSSNSQEVPLVLLHGLFGSLSNLGMLARAFIGTRTVLQVDLRNHGKSSHSSEFNYDVMARDVLETLDHLKIDKFSVIGHSMGGKIALKLPSLAQGRVEKAIILDMSPRRNESGLHTEIFSALLEVQAKKLSSRSEAAELMRKYMTDESVIQFLLKSYNKGSWLFNVEILNKCYGSVLDWEIQQANPVDILFLKGDSSSYISRPVDYLAIEQQFPHARIETVQGAGHWLHAEKTEEVITRIKNHLRR